MTERHFLLDPELTFGEGTVVSEPIVSESKPDFLVKVERQTKPVYPLIVKSVLHPELELRGPEEFIVSSLRKCFYADEKTVNHEVIYRRLVFGKILPFCLNLQDGYAIQAKGITVFCNVFGSKAVFLWASTGRDQDGEKIVPFAFGANGTVNQVVIGWAKMNQNWNGGQCITPLHCEQ
jgi:hypothetical protein